MAINFVDAYDGKYNEHETFTDVELAYNLSQQGRYFVILGDNLYTDAFGKINDFGVSSYNQLILDIYGYFYGTNDTMQRLYKLDFDGNVIWDYQWITYSATSIFIDNKYVYVGEQGGVDGGHLHKIDFNGNRIWRRRHDNYDHLSDITVDSNGFIYVAKTYDKTRIQKISPDGNLLWQRSLTYPLAVSVDKDGYVYAGGGNNRLYKLNPNDGNNIWTKNLPDRCRTIRCDSQGNVILMTESDVRLRKYSSSGNLIFEKNFTNELFLSNKILDIDTHDNIIASESSASKIRKYNSSGTLIDTANIATSHVITSPGPFVVSQINNFT